MSDYQHCPEGLALYLGAECEYLYTVTGYEITGPLDLQDIVSFSAGLCKDFTLFMRPLSNMTEEERTERDNLESNFTCITDWARCKGFDVGGWCMKGGEKVWVDSYISVGLAKEVKQ